MGIYSKASDAVREGNVQDLGVRDLFHRVSAGGYIDFVLDPITTHGGLL